MATENTTETPAAAAAPPPAAEQTTQAQSTAVPPPAQDEPVDLKGVTKDAHKAAITAAIAAKKAAQTQPPEASAPPASETGQPAAAAAEPAKEGSPPPEPKPDPKAKDEELELEAAKKLNEIALAGKRQRERIAREQAEAKSKIDARERELAAREERIKAEAARVDAIAKAKASGKRLEVLRAAGYTDEEIQGDFFLGAMKELQDAPAASAAPATKPEGLLTKEEALALIKQEREAAAEAERQRIAAQQAANLKAQQDQYFAGIAQDFNKGDFPILKSLPKNLRPTHAQMHEYLMDHYRRTGESLKSDELLSHMEKDYRDAGFAPLPKPGKPAPKPPAATTRTITPGATSDAGTNITPPEPKKDRKMSEIRDEGFRKWQESKKAARP